MKHDDIYTKTLYDALERKEYGHYWWKLQEGKKQWEVPPLECQVDEKTCQSEAEFDLWLQKHMED